MNCRSGFAVLLAVLSLPLTACPPAPGPDGGSPEFDGGNPPAQPACSGGCAMNQVCDPVKRTCVDACGGCDGGQLCAKIGGTTFACTTPAVTCGGNVCEPGQVACQGGGCACLSSLSGNQDTCNPLGKWCNGVACANPGRYDECIPGGAACPLNHLCQKPFSSDLHLCLKNCTGSNQCDRGEDCSAVGCLPTGLFNGQGCIQFIPTADGGFERDSDGGIKRLTVPVSNTCLLIDANGNITDQPGKGSGNCTYQLLRLYTDGIYPLESCRPPGQATEGQPCRDDFTTGAIATQCATGLECALTRGGGLGVCMRMCNANPPRQGFTPLPGCSADEACVNLHRFTDPSDNAVVGVCAKKCNVFDAAKDTCAPVGSYAASCVPATPDGTLLLSLTGDGICLPQQAAVAQPNAACSETDAFHGAACGDAQLCGAAHPGDPATCIQVCDVACNPSTDAGVPAACATEPNARCTGGKTCTRVTTTSGARPGYCL